MPNRNSGSAGSDTSESRGTVGGRQVRRATQEARAGLPVIIVAEQPLIALAVETASEQGRDMFMGALAGGAGAILLVAAHRADAVLGTEEAGAEIAALQLPTAVTLSALRALADPTETIPAVTVERARLPGAAAAALLLAKLARLMPAMLVAPAAADALDLVKVDAADVLAHPARADTSLVRVAEAVVPLAEAPDARLVAFRPADGGLEHVALLIGRPEQAAAPLVRIHSECFTGDVLGSLRCDCGPQLHHAMRRMTAEGAGALLYMAQEGRGIGLVNKLRAYALQDEGLDTLDANRALGWGADERSFAAAATMLRSLGLTRIRLLTNNPEKMAQLIGYGIEVVERLRHAIAANGVNDAYLETKARRFGHMLE
jgi:GTP cyclohydrolase II